MLHEKMNVDLATHRQRARFEAVRRRVFDDMKQMGARMRLAVMLPFNILVLTVLALRGAPTSRVVIQLVAFAFCLLTLAIADRRSPPSRGLTAIAATSLLIGIANTGGLASPLLIGVVPFVVATSLAPDLAHPRGVFAIKFILTFGVMAALSQTETFSLTEPLVPHGRHPSVEFVIIALANASLVVISMFKIGRAITIAHERIALELAERRDELCDESEGRTRALEGIAARLAHEVKNPLAAIKGLSTHVARNASDPKVKERLSIVAAEAERLQEIVEGFLSFSRGLDELHVEATKPFEIARELSLLLETRAADAGVTLDVRGSRELELTADPKRLRQALLNLVLNAMQASSAGATVTVEIAKNCADGAAVIRVVDRGAGMTADILERIQKPYYTTKEGGSGLGIAVARGIIEQHGGTLRFESASGRGTAATVTLPAAPGAMRCQMRLPNPCREYKEALEKMTPPAKADAE